MNVDGDEAQNLIRFGQELSKKVKKLKAEIKIVFQNISNPKFLLLS